MYSSLPVGSNAGQPPRVPGYIAATPPLRPAPSVSLPGLGTQPRSQSSIPRRSRFRTIHARRRQRDRKSESAHRCRVCHETFTRNTSLQRHAKVHLPAPYHCEFEGCHAKFSRKDVRKRHRDFYHKGTGLWCTSCSTSVRKDAYNKHRSTRQCKRNQAEEPSVNHGSLGTDPDSRLFLDFMQSPSATTVHTQPSDGNCSAEAWINGSDIFAERSTSSRHFGLVQSPAVQSNSNLASSTESPNAQRLASLEDISLEDISLEDVSSDLGSEGSDGSTNQFQGFTSMNIVRLPFDARAQHNSVFPGVYTAPFDPIANQYPEITDPLMLQQYFFDDPAQNTLQFGLSGEPMGLGPPWRM